CGFVGPLPTSLFAVVVALSIVIARPLQPCERRKRQGGPALAAFTKLPQYSNWNSRHFLVAGWRGAYCPSQVQLVKMNGCSKRKTHRWLHPFFELRQTFPKIQHWQGTEILHRLKQKEKDASAVHPCMDTWGDYMQCLRRYPDTSTVKCRVESDRHTRCLQLNRTWKPSDSLQAQKLLEMFHVFNETSRFKYGRPPLQPLVRGCVVPFADANDSVPRRPPDSGGHRPQRTLSEKKPWPSAVTPKSQK
ncbi:hypothetical protein CSUI_002099, partial [Cystoisospora suis]